MNRFVVVAGLFLGLLACGDDADSTCLTKNAVRDEAGACGCPKGTHLEVSICVRDDAGVDVAPSTAADGGRGERPTRADAGSVDAAGRSDKDAAPNTAAPLDQDAAQGPGEDAAAPGATPPQPTPDAGMPMSMMPPSCVPVAETCDGKDNDCDDVVDNGLKNACGAACGVTVPPEDCGTAKDDNCDGQVNEGCAPPPPSCAPKPEVCDGKDSDCDGVIDNGVLNACGKCGAVPVEKCNGMDDNCNGQIDEGVKNACDQCGVVPAEVCDSKDNDCDGKVDEGVTNACGACGAVPVEVCDGQDNDCNGVIDNGVKNACGACGAVPAEACDGRDNDCDGTTDEGCPPAARCGDGQLDRMEECDDGNAVDNDRCRNDCTWRTYAKCTGVASGECRVGELCMPEIKMCMPPCQDTFGCRSGGANTSPVCTTAGTCLLLCSSSAECPTGMSCNPDNGLCAW